MDLQTCPWSSIDLVCWCCFDGRSTSAAAHSSRLVGSAPLVSFPRYSQSRLCWRLKWVGRRSSILASVVWCWYPRVSSAYLVNKWGPTHEWGCFVLVDGYFEVLLRPGSCCSLSVSCSLGPSLIFAADQIHEEWRSPATTDVHFMTSASSPFFVSSLMQVGRLDWSSNHWTKMSLWVHADLNDSLILPYLARLCFHHLLMPWCSLSYPPSRTASSSSPPSQNAPIQTASQLPDTHHTWPSSPHSQWDISAQTVHYSSFRICLSSYSWIPWYLISPQQSFSSYLSELAFEIHLPSHVWTFISYWHSDSTGEQHPTAVPFLFSYREVCHRQSWERGWPPRSMVSDFDL